MAETLDKRLDWLKYLNTLLLTFISVVLIQLSVSVNQVKKEQIAQGTELVRMKTVQDINTASISSIDKRVSALELNYLDYIKTWVSDNFQRKPGK
jgi:ABC-type Fe3+-citrate transport system substrate-binding protein